VLRAAGRAHRGFGAAVPAGAALHLFATTSMGIFLATVARTMPQFGLLLILTLLPLQMLSGGMHAARSMPLFVQRVMLVAPTTHFVELAQAILYRRGAGSWRSSAVLFALSLARFRKTISQMA
jgi:ABC-2 type transport system permease protein